jgi:hypothetical protein
MKNCILVLITFFVFVSCKKVAVEKPKVTYNKTSEKPTVTTVDTTKIAVAGLPIQFDSTNYLLYPIGNINTESKRYDSTTSDIVSYTVSNAMDNEITGYLQNIKFQKTDSDTLISLTNKPMLIQSVNYLATIAVKSKQQTLAYLLADSDTNEDGKLDTNDIKSLYLSTISGEKFTKISTDFQEVLDWKILDSRNRLYFRTVEDTNKNGEFDKNDKVHYFFVNVLEKEWKAVEFTVN